MALLSPVESRKLSMPDKFGTSVVLFSAGRVDTLGGIITPYLDSGGMIDSSFPDARMRWEWNSRVMVRSNTYVPLGPVDPFSIPSSYDEDNDGSTTNIINSDAQNAVELAIRWLVRGNSADGAAAVRVLNAWSNLNTFTTVNDSRLVWSNRWPVFLQAATMLKSHPDYTPALHSRLVDVTTRGLALSPAATSVNNWGAWGVCLELASYSFIGDRAGFNRAIYRWQTLFDGAVLANIPVHEIYRQKSGSGDGSTGLWYSNFLLSALTAGAEWARFNGEWLYDYKNTEGSSLKGLYENIRHWTRYPAEYPYNTSGVASTTSRSLSHDEILYPLWPSEEGKWILDNFPRGSDRDFHGIKGAVLAYRYRPLWG